MSLLDLAYRHPIDVWLVFQNHDTDALPWLWPRLEPGFQHVEAWRKANGVWLRANPALEHMDFDACDLPPWVITASDAQPTFMRVRRSVPMKKVRDWFHIGPVTCVEMTKALIGVRSFRVRTPYQLFKYLVREGGHQWVSKRQPAA